MESMRLCAFVFLFLVVQTLLVTVWLETDFCGRLASIVPPTSADTAALRGNSLSLTAALTLPANLFQGYLPATTEKYILQNAARMGFGSKVYTEKSAGCPLWNDATVTNEETFAQLVQFRRELAEYSTRVKNFHRSAADLRRQVMADGNYDVCKTVDLHPDGVRALFNSSGQLSLSSSGYVEPLLPPMRHPNYCDPHRDNKDRRAKLFDLSYLVHDFGTMCRKLKPTSRIVLFDIGASLTYAGVDSPAIYLTEIYDKFGFPFDHIYAYEVNPTEPKVVFNKVPRKMLPAYHWINVGVDTTPGGHLNPFTILLDKYNEDDLIVVKLDIDTPSLELPLARQVLEDERLQRLVDQFYFEHHVPLWELRRDWKVKVSESVQESLELFHELRTKGVPAHFWV